MKKNKKKKAKKPKYQKDREKENAIKIRDWEKNSLFGLSTHKHILW